MINITKREDGYAFGIVYMKYFGHDDWIKTFWGYFWKWIIWIG